MQDIVHQDLQKASFIGISTDGSNHGHEKLFPIVAQYFDHEENGIQVKMLDLQETKFIPLSIKSNLSKLRAKGKERECDDFVQQVMTVYIIVIVFLRNIY